MTQLLGGRGIGVRKHLFFHLSGSRPEQDEMKTHVTIDIRETEQEFQVDMPPLEQLDMNVVTRAKTTLFRTAKELAKGNRRRAAPRWSSPAELLLMCASPSYQLLITHFSRLANHLVRVHRNTNDPNEIALRVRQPLFRFRDSLARFLGSKIQCR